MTTSALPRCCRGKTDARPHQRPARVRKTTLARALAPLIGCPVVSRDEVKRGIVHAAGGDRGEWGGPISKRTLATFSATVHLLLEAGVTHIAEAAFRSDLAAADLRALTPLAKVRIVHCTVDDAVSYARIVRRSAEDEDARAAHPDAELVTALDDGTLTFEMFGSPLPEAPTLHVDTTDGYHPSLDEIVAFVNA